MHTLSKHTLSYAIALSALAGCVDAIGFMQLGGFFVSFMSGNSTRLAVGLQMGDWNATRLLLSIIGCFVIGATAGAAMRNRSAWSNKAAHVMAIVSALFCIAALFDAIGLPSFSMLILAVAMGAENSVLQSNGENVIGVTYMTGTLVKMGQRLAAALQGSDRLAWFPYLLLWFGLILGGITGAYLFTHYGFNALWFPATCALLLTIVMIKIGE